MMKVDVDVNGVLLGVGLMLKQIEKDPAVAALTSYAMARENAELKEIILATNPDHKFTDQVESIRLLLACLADSVEPDTNKSN